MSQSETPLYDELMRDFGVKREEIPALVSTFVCIIGKFPGPKLKSGERCIRAGFHPNDVWRRALQIVRSPVGAA